MIIIVYKYSHCSISLFALDFWFFVRSSSKSKFILSSHYESFNLSVVPGHLILPLSHCSGCRCYYSLCAINNSSLCTVKITVFVFGLGCWYSGNSSPGFLHLIVIVSFFIWRLLYLILHLWEPYIFFPLSSIIFPVCVFTIISRVHSVIAGSSPVTVPVIVFSFSFVWICRYLGESKYLAECIAYGGIWR